MEFYKKLSKYYDNFVKEDSKTIDFLIEKIPTNATILDAGCATGIYSLALCDEGFNVIGIDNDSYMVDKARENRKFLPIKFYKYDIRDIASKFNENEFHEIFSLNNTLSYLMDKDEILETLKAMFSRLKEGGTLILEIRNYANLLNDQNKITFGNSSPMLIDEYLPSNSDKIILKETLISKNKYLEEEKSIIEIPLLPISKSEINDLLREAGFINIEHFSDFNKSIDFTNSTSIIIRAMKEASLLDDTSDYEDYDVNVVQTESKGCCSSGGGCCKK